jgi:hypothetical protein
MLEGHLNDVMSLWVGVACRVVISCTCLLVPRQKRNHFYSQLKDRDLGDDFRDGRERDLVQKPVKKKLKKKLVYLCACLPFCLSVWKIIFHFFASRASRTKIRDDSPPPEAPIDPNEPTYCLCDQVVLNRC